VSEKLEGPGRHSAEEPRYTSPNQGATSLVVTGIGELFDGTGSPPAAGMAIVVEESRIAWIGPEKNLGEASGGIRLDVAGRAVIPGFVDSHTHLVFAGDRAGEWEARMAGRPYVAGGIARTVEATRAATTRDLSMRAQSLAAEALRAGTTTIEVKSGYGLDVRNEARLVQVAAALTKEVTFLGAHVVPSEYAGRCDDYVELVCGQMLEACRRECRWIDVFCDEGAFDADQARTVLEAGSEAGLGLRLHANQLRHGPGASLAAAVGAASVDHCTHLADADVEALAGSSTVVTLLPAAEFSTKSPYPDARRLLDAGVRVALATDCNPGTSFTTSMSFVIALAVRELAMTVTEALHAATGGGADALLRNDIGRLEQGKRADFVVLDAPSVSWIAYRPGVPMVAAVFRLGELVAGTLPRSLL
jgi:imidazolonepropionase